MTEQSPKTSNMKKFFNQIANLRVGVITAILALIAAIITFCGVISAPVISTSYEDFVLVKHANETLTGIALTPSATHTPTFSFTPSITPTLTLTPTFTSTATSIVTPLTNSAITLTSNAGPTQLTEPVITPNTHQLIVISGRPKHEITFCSQDKLDRAGIKVIARWLKDGRRGFYIAAQTGMGISHFRMSGWDYLPPTQINRLSYEDPSDICGYDAPWSVWIDEHAIDPTTRSKITIDFLNDEGTVVEQVGFTLE
jgi:hypothetical protein